jgi:hypothetical protein
MPRSSDGCRAEQFNSVVCKRFSEPVSGRGLSPFGGRMGPGYEHVLGLCPLATPGTTAGSQAREKETRR